MRKHFTIGQIKWIIIICLSVEVLTNIDDVIRGFKSGWQLANVNVSKK